MQKYLSLKNRQNKKRERQSEENPLIRLRRQLQMQDKVARQILQAALAHSKIESIRQVLYFRKYEQLKPFIDPHMKEDQLSRHELLSRIYAQSILKKEKKEDRERSTGPASSADKNKQRIIIAVAIGVVMFVLGFLLRTKLKLILKNIFRK